MTSEQKNAEIPGELFFLSRMNYSMLYQNMYLQLTRKFLSARYGEEGVEGLLMNDAKHICVFSAFIDN